MNNFPSNINPQTYTFKACLITSTLTKDFDAYEQSSIGNCLMLVSEFMLTAAFQPQLIEARLENFNININSREHKNDESFYKNLKLQEELEALKKN